MGRLYVLNQGETLFDSLHRIQGRCDSPFTLRGVEQARQAGAWMAERGLCFDHVYASASGRSRETLSYALPGAVFEHRVELCDGCYGSYEGLPQDVMAPIPYGSFYVPFGGESWDAFSGRVLHDLDVLLSRPGHDCVLAACDSGVAYMLRVELGVEECDYRGRFGPCTILELECGREGGWTLRSISHPVSFARHMNR
nr:histidine phosphatase family protein [Collinsella sp. BA40]